MLASFFESSRTPQAISDNCLFVSSRAWVFAKSTASGELVALEASSEPCLFPYARSFFWLSRRECTKHVVDLCCLDRPNPSDETSDDLRLRALSLSNITLG